MVFSMRSNLFIIIFKLVSVLLQILFTKFIAVSFQREDIAFYAFLMSLVMFFNAVFFTPLDTFLQNKTLSRKLLMHDVFLTTGIFFSGSCIVILFLLCILHYFFSLPLFIFIALPLVAFLSMSLFFQRFFLKIGDIIQYNKLIIFEALLKLLMAYLMNLIVPGVIAVFFISLLLSQFFTFSYGFKVIKFQKFSNTLFEFNKTRLYSILGFTFPLALTGVIGWIQTNFYKLTVLRPNDIILSDVGTFFLISGIGSSVASVFANLYQQKYLKSLYNSDSSLINYCFRIIFYFTLLGFILFFFSDVIVLLLTSEKFTSNSRVLIYGFIIEALYLLCGAVEIKMSQVNNNNYILLSHSLGLISMFYLISYFDLNTNFMASIGNIMVLSTLVRVISLLAFHFSARK